MNESMYFLLIVGHFPAIAMLGISGVYLQTENRQNVCKLYRSHIWIFLRLLFLEKDEEESGKVFFLGGF